MPSSFLRRRLGWTLVILSLLLHVFTVYCFARQPDRFAAYTVMPIWLWGGVGLLFSSIAFYFLRAPLSLVVTAVWAITLLVGADEARVLANFGKPAPLPGPAAPYQGKAVVRVLTLNCANFGIGDPSADIAAWQPDVVLLQQAFPYQVRRIAEAIYQGKGDFRSYVDNGVVTRWKIQREIRNPSQHNQQVGILLPDNREIEVVNVHLATAATNLRLWNRAAWREHRQNRAIRREELSISLQVLDQTTDFPEIPTLLGGDFNSPASDTVHFQLTRDFTDAFSAAGTGWGNTFQRRLPILRIDHIYATRHFAPVRALAVTTRASDHRMVVADFILK